MTHRGLFLAVLAILGATPAGAVSVDRWSASSAAEFELGTMDGTALDDRGALLLAPALVTLWGPEAGIVWSLSSAPSGGTFIGLSSPGRVVYLPGDGPAEVWFETGEDSLIAAVVADGSGGVYFGLSPEGTVFHSKGQDQTREVASTGAKFVWALERAEDGSVWIGTGIPGHVKRLMPDGELLNVFDAEDDPVRCITRRDQGGVLVGTGGRGRVIRVDATGAPFVLLDAEEAEIVSIVADEEGAIFALAASSSKQVASPRTSSIVGAVETVRVTANGPSNGEAEGETSQPRTPEPRPAPQSFKMRGGAALYRIDPEGGSRRIWESAKDVPFMMTRGRPGELLVATGDEGRIYGIDARGRAAVHVTVGSEQASAIVADSEGRILIGGTTDARIERLGPKLRRAGSYVTAPIDAASVAEWGRVSWESVVPRGARLALYSRAGNSSDPDATWTDWTAVRSTREGEGENDLPATRWVQLRFDLQPSRADETPSVRRVELHYRVHNRRPTVEALNVQPAGVVWTLTPVQSNRHSGPVVADDPVARKLKSALAGTTAHNPPVRKSYEQGARTLSWDAADPDGDRLTYSLEVRREGSEIWVPIVRDLEERHLSFDTRGMPDGFYRARLRATDERDNAAGRGLDDLESSTVFQIDNTRPSVSQEAFDREGAGYRIQFLASDPGGNVAAVEIAVDGGAWVPLDPLDGVADSSEERYRTVIDEGAWEPGASRTLRVRVTDAAGNLGGDAWSFD